MARKFAAKGVAAIAVLMATTLPVLAQSVEAFYRGKSINLILGSTPGTAYDNWARILVQFLPKYIPGNPAFVIQAMPGAGHVRATNYLYTAAPKDGLTIGIISQEIPLAAVLGNRSGLAVDFAQFNMLGTPERVTRICAVRKGAGIQSAEDLFAKELTVGGAGAGGGESGIPNFLEAVFGMKFKIVEGYPSAAEVMLALDRAEVDGVCQTYEGLKQRRPNAIADGSLKILFTLEEKPIPGNSAPSIFKFVKTEQQRQMLTVGSIVDSLGRPIIAPPDIPKDRADALRNAFDQVWKDPEFLATAKSRGMEAEPISGQEFELLFKRLQNTPASILQQMARIVK
jgi:tripartite-type tricarboxylate transporter receptor subunit TctC